MQDLVGDHMSMLLRATRSTGPREVLLKLATDRIDLNRQLMAVAIQAASRGFLARRRVKQMLNNLMSFLVVTDQLTNVLIEEIVISTTLEMCMDSYKTLQRYKEVIFLTERALLTVSSSIITNEVDEMLHEVVKETIEDANSIVLNRIKQNRVEDEETAAKRNPVLFALLEVCFEVADDCTRKVVIEAVKEETVVYLLRLHSKDTAETLTESFLYEESLGVLVAGLTEAKRDTNIPESSLRAANNLIREVFTRLETAMNNDRTTTAKADIKTQDSVTRVDSERLVTAALKTG